MTPIDTPMDVTVNSDSQALVPVSPMNMDALAVVPVNSKPKRSELSQRRVRRPFSVTEVEALVEAVEKLGTGRYTHNSGCLSSCRMNALILFGYPNELFLSFCFPFGLQVA